MQYSGRWYDSDPRISLAVACLEKASPLTQRRLARAIIKKAKAMDVNAKDHHIGFFRRWYDESRAVSLAMEYFKVSPPLLQRAIAEYLIAKLINK
ncbi:MAG TPA: hypothetical protein DDW90_10850 [Cyanobacteria bacterium UBA9971]|nr:hypothetical protein [Cyanobacteria bacterium UBA9971]